MMRETKLGKLQRKRNILPIEANINNRGKKGCEQTEVRKILFALIMKNL